MSSPVNPFMSMRTSYRVSLGIAIVWHLLIAFLLCYQRTSPHPVLQSQPQANQSLPMVVPTESAVQPIKATSVDNQAVMETVNRLKNERLQQRVAEENRQQALELQAQRARQQREVEQARLRQLKEEAEKLAILRAKKIQEERQHLKEIAEAKAKEEQRLAEMKKQQKVLQKQQALEVKRLAELKIQQDKQVHEQHLKEQRIQEEQRQAAQAKANAEKLAQQKALAEQQAKDNAARLASIAGEVDKYKALILNAIGRQWILPENVNQQLSSQFHIRLAPNGAVLEVSLIKSSGDPILDRSAQSAIYKASPLPVPVDPATFNIFREISLTVRPENVRG